MRKWPLFGVCVLVALALCGPVALARAAQPRDTGVTWSLGPTFPSNTGNVPTVAPTQDTQLDFDIPSYAAVGWEVYSGDGDTVDINLVPAAKVTGGLRQSCASAAPMITVGTTSAPSDSLTGSLTIPWPKNATIAAGGAFWVVCLHEHLRDAGFAYGGDLMSGTSANATDTAANGGLAFKVLTDTVPAAGISASTVAQGQTLTVRGTGWLYYHAYTAYGANTACGAVQIKTYPGGGTYQIFDGKSFVPDVGGNWSVTFSISEAPGTYYASIGCGYFQNYAYGIPFNVVPVSSGGTGSTPSAGAKPTTTPTPHAATVTATAHGTTTPNATQTPGEIVIAGADRPPSGSGGFPWLAVLLGLVVVAGLGGGGALYRMRRGHGE